MDFATSRTEIRTETEVFPPPYTPPTEDLFGDDDEDFMAPTTNITIHVPTSIHGSNNIVNMPPLDTTRVAAILMAALNQKNNQAAMVGARQSNFNIQFNCGVHVVGDKNVVGNVGIRPRPTQTNPAAPSPASPTSPAPVPTMSMVSIASKRQASEVCYSSCKQSRLATSTNPPVQDPDDCPPPKKIDIDTIAGSLPSPVQ